MSELLKEIQVQLGKPYKDLEFLLNCFREVLEENGEEEISKQIPWINDLDSSSFEDITEKHIQLYSLVFQLVNMAEINGAVQHRRQLENKDLSLVNGLWARNFKVLKEANIKEDDILERLGQMSVEPVLTAHPTEAKRATVLEHHRELYLLIVMRENQMYTEKEKANIRNNVKLCLYRLWKTGEVFVEKPDVPSELRNIMHYLVNVFPEVIPVHDRRLRQAWEDQGFSIDKLYAQNGWPKITFGN